jgi:hypothetical protein
MKYSDSFHPLQSDQNATTQNPFDDTNLLRRCCLLRNNLTNNAGSGRGLADQGLQAVASTLSSKELNLLASETLGPFHGDAGFGGGFGGGGGNPNFEGYPGGALGPVAIASRSALLASILRGTSHAKVLTVNMAMKVIWKGFYVSV